MIQGTIGCGKAAVAIALVFGVLLGGCASPQGVSAPQSIGSQVEKAPPKRVLAAIRSSPPSLAYERITPGGTGASMAGLDAIQQLVHAGLAHFDNQDAIHPQLAQAVPTLENGLWTVLPDGRMETTWRIKEAARWHDGTPVTSADLLFTVQVEQDKELGIFRHAAYDLIEAVEALDSHTVMVKWRQPYIDADTMFSYLVGLPLPRHLLEKTYIEDKASFLGVPYWTQEFVGAGPYKLREWVIDSHVILQAYDQYVLGRPSIDEIEVKFIADPNTMLANVLASAVEVTLGRGLDLDQGLQVRSQWKDGTAVFRSTGWFKVSPQFIDTNPPIVTELRFRRALMHAVDRQQMADTFMGGQSSVADTFVLPNTDEYQAAEPYIVRYDYNPRRATEILEGLGYAKGPDGFFRDSPGQKLSVEVRTTIGLAIQGNITLALAEFWKQVGVDVQTVLIPVQQMTNREYRATFPAFEMVSAGIGLTPRDIGRHHSSRTPLAENRYSVTGNDPRYRNPEFDTLIEKYIATIPKQERLQTLGQIVRHQTEQLNIMGLFYSVNPSVSAYRLQNVMPRGRRSTEAWNVHQWDVR